MLSTGSLEAVYIMVSLLQKKEYLFSEYITHSSPVASMSGSAVKRGEEKII